MKFVALVGKILDLNPTSLNVFLNISLDKKYKVSNVGDFALATKLSL